MVNSRSTGKQNLSSTRTYSSRQLVATLPTHLSTPPNCRRNPANRRHLDKPSKQASKHPLTLDIFTDPARLYYLEHLACTSHHFSGEHQVPPSIMASPTDGTAVPRNESPTRSPRSASISLQAAATMNAGLQHEPTRRSSSSSLSRHRSSPQAGRRRSTVLMNLQLNDPSIPAPGEMVSEESGLTTASPRPISGSPLLADPHHHRAPSLGELHQELEAEQEAHVNRLLQMIRQQQLELQRLQAGQPQNVNQTSAVDDSSAISERSGHGTPHASTAQIAIPPSLPSGGSGPRSATHRHPRSSFDMARADLQRRSRTPSRSGASPRLRSTSIGGESGDWVLGGRDESAFYQAETQMLVRENQMLRHRIRELEKQLSDLGTGSPTAHEPPHHSSLTRSSTTAEKEEEKPLTEAPKET